MQFSLQLLPIVSPSFVSFCLPVYLDWLLFWIIDCIADTRTEEIVRRDASSIGMYTKPIFQDCHKISTIFFPYTPRLPTS